MVSYILTYIDEFNGGNAKIKEFATFEAAVAWVEDNREMIRFVSLVCS